MRKILYGRIVIPYTDEAIRNLFPSMRADFSAVVFYLNNDACVWSVVDVTSRSLKLRAYFEDSYMEQTHKITGKVLYALAPSNFIINKNH